MRKVFKTLKKTYVWTSRSSLREIRDVTHKFQVEASKIKYVVAISAAVECSIFSDMVHGQSAHCGLTD